MAGGPTSPEGRMAFAILLGLFFAAFAAGSIHSPRQEYRWRNGLWAFLRALYDKRHHS